MVEKMRTNNEFEQNMHHERERKLLPLFPERLQEFRHSATPIEQYYLSHPDEPFSLRLREAFNPDGSFEYSATLKDRGVVSGAGLDRMEIEVRITAELYEFYKQSDAPILRKLRYAAHPDLSIDYYDDGHMQIESENDDALNSFVQTNGDCFVDVSGDRIVDNEWRAHLEFRRQNDGAETLRPNPDIDIDHVAAELIRKAAIHEPAVVQLCGRSGSGKSTIVRSLQDTLRRSGFESMVLSTDDYHRGASWLRHYNDGKDWTRWDDPIVYDTAAMANDLHILLNGGSIASRTIDFSVAEPRFGSAITAQPVIILEGIYATSDDFKIVDTVRIDIPTPLATCIGRRLLRDMSERPEFADPQRSLLYMLEQAEPMWRAQTEA